MKKLAAFAIVALVACGGSDTTDPGNTVSNSATITLSGAVTGTFTATTETMVWGSAGNQGSFGFSVGSSQNPTASAPAIAGAIDFTGEPAVGTYKNTDASAVSALTVETSSFAFWTATDSHESGAQGSYTLTITSISTTATVSTGKVYKAHGTLTATLPALGGTSGTGSVTMTVTF